MIQLESHDESTTILTLNRPEKRNALSRELIEQITSSLRQVEADTAKRVLIIRAAGPSFCAGLDMAEASMPGGAETTAQSLAQMYEVLCETPLVTIAAVNGSAVGGGAGLAIACDFVIASAEDFKLGFPEVHRGIVAALVTAILRRQVSDRIARELILLGRTIDAERAMQLGLANRVVSRDQLPDESLKLARQVCRGAPNAIVRSKRLLDDLSPRPIGEELHRALKYHLDARNSSEAIEGVNAFIEKREPRWGSRS